MKSVATLVLIATCLAVAGSVRAASLTVINGKVVQSDGAVSVSKDGGTTTISDKHGNVIIRSTGGDGVSSNININSNSNGGSFASSISSVDFGSPIEPPKHVTEKVDTPSAPTSNSSASSKLSDSELKTALLKVLLELLEEKVKAKAAEAAKA